MNDLYNLLEVPRDASMDEIKHAYRRLIRELHPDRNPGNEEAETRLKAITIAYRTLIKAPQRQQEAVQWTDYSIGNSYLDGDCEYSATLTPTEARAGTSRTLQFHRADGQPYSITVIIPAGVRIGAIVRVVGAGGPSADGCRRGDLLVRIEVSQ